MPIFSRLKFFSFGLIFCLSISPVWALDFNPKMGSIYKTLPKQLVKSKTASVYIYETEADVNGDDTLEVIIGANCIETFCENFIFKRLNNRRYEYLSKAKFDQNSFELVMQGRGKMADILYYRKENIGQGCLGRHQFAKENGYKMKTETCRLPKAVSQIFSSYYMDIENTNTSTPLIKRRDLDYIDFEGAEVEDEDLFSTIDSLPE